MYYYEKTELNMKKVSCLFLKIMVLVQLYGSFIRFINVPVSEERAYLLDPSVFEIPSFLI